MIEPTDADVGRLVIYRSRWCYPHLENVDIETGTISSFNDHYVHVNYRGYVKSTRREDLYWPEDDVSLLSVPQSLD